MAYSWVAGAFARFTWPITVAVAIPGIAVVAAAWLEPVRDSSAVPKLATTGVIAWACVFVALGLWELTALLMQPALTVNSWAHPTISYLLDPVLNHHHLDRSLALASWLAFGWYLRKR